MTEASEGVHASSVDQARLKTTQARTPRVGIVGLWHETNTYSPRQTELKDFRGFEYLSGDELLARHFGNNTVIGGFLATNGESQLVPLLSAGAWPSAPLGKAGVDELLDDFAHRVAQQRVDALLCHLHGAMVADGRADVEFDLLRLLRSVVGDVPVSAVVDSHAIPSPEFVHECGAIVGYRTYPHVDFRERGIEARRLVEHMLAGEDLKCVLVKVPLLTSPLKQSTDNAPMAALAQQAAELVEDKDVESISLLPGFPYSDVERAGFSVVSVVRSDFAQAAEEACGELRDAVLRSQSEFAVDLPDARAAVQLGMRLDGPSVLVDVADNIGGGGPGDGTVLLQALLDAGARDAIVHIADPEMALKAVAAGPGVPLRMLLGGKTDDRHGEPIELDATVAAISDGTFQASGSWNTGLRFSMGPTAAVVAHGVTVIVTEKVVPLRSSEQFTTVGVDPTKARLIVVKGVHAWRAALDGVVRSRIDVDTPGCCPADPTSLQRRTQPMTWPLLEEATK